MQGLKSTVVILGISGLLMLGIELVSRYVLSNVYNRTFDSSLIIANKFGASDGLKENSKGSVWGKEFHTDEIGGRLTHEANRKKHPDKKKWLYIGDSVTEGVGVDDQSTFSSAIAGHSESNDVRNISLIGYSSNDYVLVVSHFLLQDSSIERVTLFFCLNDVYGKSKTSELPVMAKQGLLSNMNQLLATYSSSYKLLKLIVLQNSSKYFEYDLQFYEQNNSHFTESMNDLHYCDSICKTRNVQFEVVVLPYKSQLTGKHKTNRVPQELLNTFCKKKNIRCLDTSECLSKVDTPSELYLWADEIHLSEKGHSAVATFLKQELF
jgi:lysophospholipase L1-like esterase